MKGVTYGHFFLWFDFPIDHRLPILKKHLIGTIRWLGFLFAPANEKEKQEGSVLAQRYISHLLRKPTVYRGFGEFVENR